MGRDGETAPRSARARAQEREAREALTDDALRQEHPGHVAPADDPLAQFSPLVREWFAASFDAPTPAQAGAWASIATGSHTLVVAPTGSGKTLATFLSAIDHLVIPRPVIDDGRATGEERAVYEGSVIDDDLPADDDTRAPGAESPPAPAPENRCRVLYISPLKALAVDVERNLRSPLKGITAAAAARGEQVRPVEVAVRSGDTPAAERAAFARRGADILITTPESLFLLLTSKAREALRGVETVIIDEIHAVAGTKRGAHLAVSLDRLDALTGRNTQRIGLSATVRPAEEVARYLAGGRPVTIVAPPSPKQVDIDVVVPVEDMSELGAPTDPTSRARSSIWPHVEERIVDLIEQHHSTIVFANSRRLAERLTARLNEIHAERIGTVIADEWDDGPPAEIMAQSGAGRGAAPILARAHHGSVSRQQRSGIEDALKRGELPAVVATSSLELGIDMGAVDLVIQVESPPSVASGLQRIGRAGHQVGAPSKGVLFPKFRGDLVSAAVATERMRGGQIEHLHVIANPLDVAAQQIVAICAMDTVTVDDVFALLRRSAPFASLTRGALESVLDMLSGRYPSERFAELKPRLTWDRATDRLLARPGAQRLAVTSGGTIPDRGLYGVFLAGTADSVDDGAPGGDPGDVSGGVGYDGGTRAPSRTPGTTRTTPRTGGRRVGELDEEMVYESRVGDVFVLGTSSWRIVEIGRDRVEVAPAPGRPGRLPFWRADAAGRPAELGRAHGAFIRELAAGPQPTARQRLAAIGLDPFAADNLLGYLAEQRQATGVLPDDRTLLIERFRDELGDWRVVIHSPYGASVHAPWALVIAARMRERYGVDVQAQHTDDGIVLRLPDGEYSGGEYDGGLPDLTEALLLDVDTIRRDVTEQLGGSAVFAARFRECAARSLLLPRQQIGRRQPLWQQRQRAAQLLEVAAGYPEFPVVAEAARECLADVFDVAALIDLMRRIAAREVALVEVTTPSPSPFARSLLFGYVAHFIHDGDSPLAERRAAALTVDPALLAELLGTSEAPSLRDLLDPGAVAGVEASLQRLALDRRARHDDDIADLARILGPLTTAEVAARTEDGVDAPAALDRLLAARRLMQVRIAGRDHWADPADAGLLRDALGVALPAGIAETFLEPVADPLGRLLGRFARTHIPFTAGAAARRFGLGVAVVRDGLARLVDDGRLVRGEFLPWGTGVPMTAVDDGSAGADSVSERVDSEIAGMLQADAPRFRGDAPDGGLLADERASGSVERDEAPVAADAVGTTACADAGQHEGGGDGRMPVAGPDDGRVRATASPDDLVEFVDAEVLRLLRRRSLAALRAEIEPVPPSTLGRFLPAWNGIETGPAPPGRALDRLYRAVEQLAGAVVPASALETLVLPARVPGYAPALLDEAMTAGEITWSVHGAIGGGDAWIALHLTEAAGLTLRPPADPSGPIAEAIIAVLQRGGAFFFPALVDAVRAHLAQAGEATPPADLASGGSGSDVMDKASDQRESLLAADGAVPPNLVSSASDSASGPLVTSDAPRGSAPAASSRPRSDAAASGGASPPRAALPSGQEVLDALWELVFAGRVTSDTLSPLRAKLADGRTAHRTGPASPRARLRSPSRLALLASSRAAVDPSSGARTLLVPAHAAGRWSLLPEPDTDPTVRAHAAAEILLDRYGVVTRGSVMAEDVPGGFAGVYRILAAMEESGRIRRGYFVEGLGAAQFADAGAVDRLRAMAPRPGDPIPGLDAVHDEALVLATADPANPYGAALSWPDPLGASPQDGPADSARPTDQTGHRPSRRAGALVCLVAGAPVIYTERGGRTLLTFTDDTETLRRAATALADLIATGRLDSLTVSTIDGASVHGLDSPALRALRDAGFSVTPRGLRLRAGQVPQRPRQDQRPQTPGRSQITSDLRGRRAGR